MTIIIAYKDRGDIIILSDTMISFGGAERPKIIPGRLKAVVIGLRLSIAYAGHSATGIDAIRTAKRSYDAGEPLEVILSALATASLSNCEFVVASHMRGTELRKVWNGHVSDTQSEVWAGDSEPLVELRRIEEEFRGSLVELPPAGHSLDYRPSSFVQLFLRSARFSDTVGGLPMQLEAWRLGHFYSNRACVYYPGPFIVNGPPDPDTPPEGGDRYTFHTAVSGMLGAGVAGAYLEDARVGYVYDPLVEDEAIVMRATTLEETCAEVRRRAIKRGGFDWRPVTAGRLSC